MEFVKNCWYVAGWSLDFSRELTAMTILGENVVLYRTADDVLCALQDRCPHKLLPLSKGKLIGDDIQCGYHGMTFDCSGRCVRVPGQDNLPEKATVRTYPVCERHGIAWIWMGDPDRASEDDIFHMQEFSDPEWAPHFGDALHLGSNYLNVAENLCDPAHVSFVHPTTLGNPESEDVPIRAERDGTTVITSRWIRNAPPVGVFKAIADFKGNVDRWHYYYLHSPNIAAIDFGSADVDANLGDDDRSEGVRIFALHFLTPVDETQTIDRWMHIRNFALDDEVIGDRMNEQFRIAFDEDKVILEAIQEEEIRCPDHKPVRIAIDKGANMYRRIVSDMVELERQQRQC